MRVYRRGGEGADLRIEGWFSYTGGEAPADASFTVLSRARHGNHASLQMASDEARIVGHIRVLEVL